MKMYQYDKRLDFHALGREIKRKREEKGWTQDYLSQPVNRTPRSIMFASLFSPLSSTIKQKSDHNGENSGTNSESTHMGA